MLETLRDMTDEEIVDSFTLKKTLIQIHSLINSDGVFDEESSSYF
jgi:hypothetical protein